MGFTMITCMTYTLYNFPHIRPVCPIHSDVNISNCDCGNNSHGTHPVNEYNNKEQLTLNDPQCIKLVTENLPLNSQGQMAVHHGAAGSYKFNDGDRWRPFPITLNTVALYIGANTDGADGVWLLKEFPGLKLHVYEPVPQFFEQLLANYRVAGILTDAQQRHMHDYGLGQGYRTIFLDHASIVGQATFIMDGVTNTTDKESLIPMRVRDTAAEIKYISMSEGKIQLLHINCEGCEWELFDSCIDANILKDIDILQFSLHYLPLYTEPAVMIQKYCKIYTSLSQTHTPEFVTPFGWERWVKKQQ